MVVLLTNGVETMPSDTYKRVRRLLAQNIQSAIEESSVNAASKVHKIPQKTLHNLTKLVINPRLGTIVDMGKALGLEAWELLTPISEREKRSAALRWMRLYDGASPAHRRMMDAVMEIVQAESMSAHEQPGGANGSDFEANRRKHSR